jgi:hypothetical protein
LGMVRMKNCSLPYALHEKCEVTKQSIILNREIAVNLCDSKRDKILMLTVPIHVSPYGSLYGVDGVGSPYHRLVSYCDASYITT